MRVLLVFELKTPWKSVACLEVLLSVKLVDVDVEGGTVDVAVELVDGVVVVDIGFTVSATEVVL